MVAASKLRLQAVLCTHFTRNVSSDLYDIKLVLQCQFSRLFFKMSIFPDPEYIIFGGACYRKEFCVSKWAWLVNKNN